MTGPGAAVPAPRIPRAVLLSVAAAALLKALPFLAVLAANPDGMAVPVGYNAKDSLQYVALIRDAAGGGGPFQANPFSLDGDTGRLFMPLLWASGIVCRATGLDPFVALELLRIPALVAFALAFWRLASEVFSERKDAVVASVAAILGTGWGAVPLLFRQRIPEWARETVESSLSPTLGWGGFDAAHNPVWLAGLAAMAVLLRRLLFPASGRGGGLGDAAVIVAAWAVHPYSGIAAAVGAAAVLLLRALRGEKREAVGLSLALLVAGSVIGLFVFWQRSDPAFAAASVGFFGNQTVTPFWYPVGLGLAGIAVAAAALTGGARSIPGGPVLVAWLGAFVWLHTSPLANGYHFLFVLGPPLALAAAPVLRSWSERRRALVWCAFAVAAGSSVWLSTRDAVEFHGLSRPERDLLRALGERHPGRIVAPPVLGGVIPAYGRHRVFAGHWFLTPAFRERSEAYRRAAADPTGAGLVALVARERANLLVLVVPPAAATELALKEAGATSILERPPLTLWEFPAPGAGGARPGP